MDTRGRSYGLTSRQRNRPNGGGLVDDLLLLNAEAADARDAKAGFEGGGGGGEEGMEAGGLTGIEGAGWGEHLFGGVHYGQTVRGRREGDDCGSGEGEDDGVEPVLVVELVANRFLRKVLTLDPDATRKRV
jgi:hypothetical protein